MTAQDWALTFKAAKFGSVFREGSGPEGSRKSGLSLLRTMAGSHGRETCGSAKAICYSARLVEDPQNGDRFPIEFV